MGSTYKNSIYRFVICGIIAFINAICTQAILTHACFGWDYLQRKSWLLMFLSGFVVAVIFSGLLDFLSSKKGLVFKSKKIFIILPFLFFICWLPYFIVYSPGLVNYDTVNQVLDFLDGVSPVPFGFVNGQEEVVALFNAHHPVLVTIIFGTFIKFGILLGNPAIGLMLYITIHMILAAVIFSFAITMFA